MRPLKQRIEQLEDEAYGHKKAVRFHRRKLRECKGEIQRLEAELARMGIKLKLQSQGEKNGKEKTPT